VSEEQLRVLLVSNDRSESTPLVEYLHQTGGYLVDVVTSNQAVLTRLEQRQGQYELILLDDAPITKSGQEQELKTVALIKEIKILYPKMEIIIFGQITKASLAALQAGAYRYLSKPINLEEVSLLIQMAIECSQLKYKALERVIAESQMLREIGAVLANLTLDEMLAKIVECVSIVLNAESSTISIFDPELVQLTQAARFPAAGVADFRPRKRGLTYRVASSGKPLIILDAQQNPEVKPSTKGRGVKSIIGIPLEVRVRHEEPSDFKVIGALLVDSQQEAAFDQRDLELLRSLAGQAAIAIQNAQLYEEVAKERDRSQWMASQLLALHETALEITSYRQTSKLISAILERAVKLLRAKGSRLYQLDENGQQFTLVGVSKGLEQFIGLTLPVGDSVVGRVIKSKAPFFVPDYRHWPDRVREYDSCDFGALIGIPIIWQGRMWGAISINDEIGRIFSREEIDLLIHFGNLAAVALENAELITRNEIARNRLHSFYEASNAVVSSHDLQQVLQDITERARGAASALGVNVMIIDQKARPRHSVITKGASFELGGLLQPDGVSMRVMRSGEPAVFPDTSLPRTDIHPSEFWRSVGAALCLPVSLEGKGIGVMWLYYDLPRRFFQDEIDALQLYANRAAIAYDSSRRIKELEYLRRAAESLANVTEPAEVLRQIVQSACEVLEANSASVSSYDATYEATEGKFTFKGSVAAGISSGVWRRFCPNASWYCQSDAWVLERGWLGVEDVVDELQLEDWLRPFYQQINARSFEGIALTVGEEKLGVLYVNYPQPRSFSAEERQTAQTFANHAALALKRAKLLNQAKKAGELLRKAQNTADIVAKNVARDDWPNTLKALVEGTRNILGCDVVTLWPYDSEREQFEFPPAMAGVRYPEEVLQPGRVTEQAVVRKIIHLEEPYFAEDRMADPRLQGNFAERERLASSVGIPLRAGGRTFGGMIISYRDRHHFTPDEKANIGLFAMAANSVALAIHNKQLFERVQRRAKVREALYKASEIVISSLDLNEQLNRIAEQAWRLTSNQHKQISYVSIRLVEGSKARVVAVYPQEALAKLNVVLGEEVDLEGSGRIGVMGRAIKERKSQRVADVTGDPDYLASYPDTHSELAVPIILNEELGHQVIGVINVEHYDKSAFDQDDERTLEALAAQVGIAIQNARQYQELEKTKGLLAARTAIAWTGMASATWQHSIKINTRKIEDLIKLLYLDLDAGESSNKLKERLVIIKRTVDQIKFKQITPPLSAEEGVELVPINDLLEEWRKQIRGSQEEPDSVECRLHLTTPKPPVVRANPQWLKLAFDRLGENSLKAMAGSAFKILEITTRLVDDRVEIAINDTGPGIPPDIQGRLLKEVIKESKHGGAGIGLLLAQMIIQVYGGDIRIGSSGPTGTTMLVYLPLIK
jgi:GAF domain-containing protein/ActR/RegA family two-component response regulator